MFTHMFVCVVVFHVRLQVCLIVKHFATNVARNVFGFQVDNLNVSFEIGFQMKLALAADHLTSESRGIVETHVLFQNSVQLESLATFFTGVRTFHFVAYAWNPSDLLGWIVLIVLLHLDLNGHLLELFLVLDVLLLVPLFLRLLCEEADQLAGGWDSLLILLVLQVEDVKKVGNLERKEEWNVCKYKLWTKAVTSSAVKSGRTTQLRSSGQESVAAKQEERRGEEAASSRRWQVNTWREFFLNATCFCILCWGKLISILGVSMYLPSFAYNVCVCPQASAEKHSQIGGLF